MSVDTILAAVADERARQDARWGKSQDRNLSPEMWLAILGEEVGEVCSAALPADQGQHGDLRHELVQVAAVCGAWDEALGGRNFADAVRVWLPVGGAAASLRGLYVAIYDLLAVEGRGPKAVGVRLVWLAARAVAWAASLNP